MNKPPPPPPPPDLQTTQLELDLKQKAATEAAGSRPVRSQALAEAIMNDAELFVRQQKEWGEILVGFEACNKYAVMDRHKNTIGMIAEQSKGFLSLLARLFLRSHRPLNVHILDTGSAQPLFHLTRKFFFFFSDLWVQTPEGSPVGSVHRRFGILHKKYDLRDVSGRTFARIKSPIWRLWTFPVFDSRGQQVGEVSKRWGGAMREVFTDADTFRISFLEGKWNAQRRAVLFAASVSIDFDFFEDNSNRSGLISLD